MKQTTTAFFIFTWGALAGYVSMDIFFNKGIDFSSLSTLFNSIEPLLFLIVGFLIFTALNPAMSRCIKINFEDIRDIEDILEALITSMNYSFVSKQDSMLEYTHTYLEPNWLTKLKLSIPTLRKMDALCITFDGNILTVKGPFMSLKKLIKNFKLYTKHI